MLAIAGAGPIAGALAQRAASRGRFRDIRLIDDHGSVAEGKALDIRQAGPVDGYDTRVRGGTALDAVVGASVVVIADRFGDGEWEGDAGLSMLARLVPLAGAAPLVFAGANQTWLMEAAHRELKVPAARIAGSAPAALEGALRALAAITIDASATDIHLRICGRPPGGLVIAWSSAVAAGGPAEGVLAAHQRFAISERARGLWPPGPIALASSATRLAEAFAFGSRRTLTAFAIGDGAIIPRGVAAAVPVRVGQGRVLNGERPALSAREQVAFDSAVSVRPPGDVA
jgi:malate dehydrogenase